MHGQRKSQLHASMYRPFAVQVAIDALLVRTFTPRPGEVKCARKVRSLAWIGSMPALIVFLLAAALELVADKLPSTPSRTFGRDRRHPGHRRRARGRLRRPRGTQRARARARHSRF